MDKRITGALAGVSALIMASNPANAGGALDSTNYTEAFTEGARHTLSQAVESAVCPQKSKGIYAFISHGNSGVLCILLQQKKQAVLPKRIARDIEAYGQIFPKNMAVFQFTVQVKRPESSTAPNMLIGKMQPLMLDDLAKSGLLPNLNMRSLNKILPSGSTVSIRSTIYNDIATNQFVVQHNNKSHIFTHK